MSIVDDCPTPETMPIPLLLCGHKERVAQSAPHYSMERLSCALGLRRRQEGALLACAPICDRFEQTGALG